MLNIVDTLKRTAKRLIYAPSGDVPQDVWSSALSAVLKPSYTYPVVGGRPPYICDAFGAFSYNKIGFGERVWKAAQLSAAKGRGIKPQICVLWGNGADNEPVWGDLCENVLISGLTGGGKTVALTGLLLSAMYLNSPQALNICIFDVKRAFAPFKDICETFLDFGEIFIKTKELVTIMKKRYSYMSRFGFTEIKDFNKAQRAGGHRPLKRTLLIFDEFALATMKTTNKEEQNQKEELKAMVMALVMAGRSAGIHLILCMQRPSAIAVSGEIKCNFGTSWAMTVRGGVNSRIAGVPGAEKLDRPGLSLLLPTGKTVTGARGSKTVQSLLISPSKIKKYIKNLKKTVGTF